MALDFPDSPNDGDTFNGFRWDDTAGVWRITKELTTDLFDYVIVASGGSGGKDDSTGSSAGGGAGGYITSFLADRSGTDTVPKQRLDLGAGDTFDVVVGAGPTDGNGNPSSITTVDFGIIEAVGGGQGGDATDPGNAGGSRGRNSSANSGSQSAEAVAGQGNKGYHVTGLPGGGGGAGGPSLGGNGGVGVVSTMITTAQATTLSVGEVSGSDVYFAGGGANEAGVGGLGGGGASYLDGTANTGGGGGAQNVTRSLGGSGVVILRYPSTYSLAVGGSLTSQTITDGDYKITAFTAGSDSVTVS